MNGVNLFVIKTTSAFFFNANTVVLFCRLHGHAEAEETSLINASRVDTDWAASWLNDLSDHGQSKTEAIETIRWVMIRAIDSSLLIHLPLKALKQLLEVFDCYPDASVLNIYDEITFNIASLDKNETTCLMWEIYRIFHQIHQDLFQATLVSN